MTTLLKIEDAYKRYGLQILLDGAEAEFSDDHKVGLIGRNGTRSIERLNAVQASVIRLMPAMVKPKVLVMEFNVTPLRIRPAPLAVIVRAADIEILPVNDSVCVPDVASPPNNTMLLPKPRGEPSGRNVPPVQATVLVPNGEPVANVTVPLNTDVRPP